jgi:nicotinate-nucleotide adenylyltransferase
VIRSNVAVFGGSFNPPHIAHVLACVLLLTLEDVDRVLVVPTYKHPFAKALASFDERARMCELAMECIPRVTVSRIEEEIGGESRTLRTLERLAAMHPDWSLRLAIGADIVAEAPRWYGFSEIEKLAPPIVLGRAGVDAPGARTALLPDVSSSRVRAAIARGAWAELESQVPRAVLAHVRSRGLYGAAPA